MHKYKNETKNKENVVLQEKVSCTRGNFHSPSI